MKTTCMRFAAFLSAGIFTASVSSADLAQSFPRGAGMRYTLESSGVQSDMSVIVASVEDRGGSQKLNVEMFMRTEQAFRPLEFWQQFELAREGNRAFEVRTGYIFARELCVPEKPCPAETLPASKLRSEEGTLSVETFLVASLEELKSFEIAEEEIETRAGKVKTTHYRQERGGQTVDFWIADLRPFGLVRMHSKGKVASQNYSIELVSTIENAAPKISPKNAAPHLSRKGKEILGIKAD